MYCKEPHWSTPLKAWRQELVPVEEAGELTASEGQGLSYPTRQETCQRPICAQNRKGCGPVPTPHVRFRRLASFRVRDRAIVKPPGYYQRTLLPFYGWRNVFALCRNLLGAVET